MSNNPIQSIWVLRQLDNLKWEINIALRFVLWLKISGTFSFYIPQTNGLYMSRKFGMCFVLLFSQSLNNSTELCHTSWENNHYYIAWILNVGFWWDVLKKVWNVFCFYISFFSKMKMKKLRKRWWCVHQKKERVGFVKKRIWQKFIFFFFKITH